jgi:protein-S-isoprenylcysteine O-methyltransferase Ste14
MIANGALHWLAAVLAYTILAITFYGVWRGTRRRAARLSGPRARWLAVPWFYLVLTALFLAGCYAAWHPLPLSISTDARTWMSALGSLLYFPGMTLALWGRLELGRNYFASSMLAVRLFENHQLVTGGPFGIVRHPMYLGLALAALGSLLIYMTWTTLAFLAFTPLLILRARMEERILAIEFRESWVQYCWRVPFMIPRLRHAKQLAMQRDRL